MSYDVWVHTQFADSRGGEYLKHARTLEHIPANDSVASASHAMELSALFAERPYLLGLETAAIVADHAGINDVNVDCRSGARIAAAIRKCESGDRASLEDVMALIALYRRYVSLNENRFESGLSWVDSLALKQEIDTKLWAALERFVASVGGAVLSM